MYPTKKLTAKSALLTAASSLFILLAGCQSPAAIHEEPPSSSLSDKTVQSPSEPDSPQKTYTEIGGDKPAGGEPHANASDASGGTDAKATALNKTPDSKAVVRTESEKAAWSSSSPKLMSVAIGDSDAAVGSQFGQELGSYTLDEGSDMVKVLEYEGFSIGVNSAKTVQFVEVYGEGLYPGLSGLRIGDQAETALRLLGKPSKQNSFMLTYKAKGALLKLDLDPEQNIIVSIKLLAL